MHENLAQANIALIDQSRTDEGEGWKVLISGFVELDMISDSTRNFTEIIGNRPVPRPNQTLGELGQTQFSIRNSRLAFDVEPPLADQWKTKGYLEMDFLGLDPTPPTSAGATNLTSEAAFFNNPTLRVRLAYLQAKSNEFQVTAGQYWSLLGWQPYYFLPSVDVAPLPGMLYGRTAQVRAMQTLTFGSLNQLQAAVAIMRPPQRDSSFPALEAGLRLKFDGRKSGYMNGSSDPQNLTPMSIALSGSIKEYQVPTVGGTMSETSHFPGMAVAANLMIPIIASSNIREHDVSNTLSFLAEFSSGAGYGNEFIGWTGGTAGPLGSASYGTASQLSAANRPLNLDAGIGDFDVHDNFKLIHLRSFNMSFQYHFDSATRTWMTLGYSQIFSNNMNELTNANGTSTSSNAPAYQRNQAVFANVFYDFTRQIRTAAEFVHVKTDYVDGTFANNNRYQLSVFFIF